MIEIKPSLATIIPDGAGPHNSIFRGKDITDKLTDGTLFSAIADGTFHHHHIRSDAGGDIAVLIHFNGCGSD
jgi:hypothetical protein